MVRRLKSELKDWDGTPSFHRATVLLEVAFTDREQENFATLQQDLYLRKGSVAARAGNTASDFIAEDDEETVVFLAGCVPSNTGKT